MAARFHPVRQKQKSPELSFRASVFGAWQFPTLAWGDPTLPSALRCFTSEFGMGSGGTTALVPPGKFFKASEHSPLTFLFFNLSTR